MTRFALWSDDHEVRVMAFDHLDVIEIKDTQADAFVDYIETQQPTAAQVDEWLAEHSAGERVR